MELYSSKSIKIVSQNVNRKYGKGLCSYIFFSHGKLKWYIISSNYLWGTLQSPPFPLERVCKPAGKVGKFQQNDSVPTETPPRRTPYHSKGVRPDGDCVPTHPKLLKRRMLFRCGYRISIRGFVRPSVGLSVGWSVRNAFVKIAKSIGKWLFFAYLCTNIACPSIHSLVCPPIILSVCLSCWSVYPSVHPFVCSHIVKMCKIYCKIE